MSKLKLALDLEGVLITNAISQFPRPGLMHFLEQCESIFGIENICIFTAVNEKRFRDVANRLVIDEYAPKWFKSISYVCWAGEHKDLRFVDDDINNVIIIDDYPAYIKRNQQHRYIQIKEYVDPYTHEAPDDTDNELECVIEKLKQLITTQRKT